MTVTSACDYAQIRRFKIFVCDIVCGYMSCYVMYRDKRFAASHSKRFRKTYPHKQRTYKTGGIGYGYTVKVIKAYIRIIKGFSHNSEDIFAVPS